MSFLWPFSSVKLTFICYKWEWSVTQQYFHKAIASSKPLYLYMTTTLTLTLICQNDFSTQKQDMLSQASSLQVSYFFIKKTNQKGQRAEPSSGPDTLDPLHHRLNLTEFLVLPSNHTPNWRIIAAACGSQGGGVSSTVKQIVLTDLFVWLTWNQIIDCIALRSCRTALTGQHC